MVSGQQGVNNTGGAAATTCYLCQMHFPVSLHRLPVLFLVVSASTASAADYRVDPARSLLVVRTAKDGPAARLAHNHVVVAKDLSGTLKYDPANPDACAVSVTVDARTLILDDPAMRKKFGETSVLSRGDVEDVRKAMLAEDQLYVARFPHLTFLSSKVTRAADGTYVVSGHLTLRGSAQPVSFPATVEAAADGTVTARGTFTVKQTQFGWKPYSAMFGAVRNKDEVTFIIELVAVPAV
ncbi:MAG: YceI family protein [Deltaproteobacteria bacterium]|nr:YceI family protein [Deltaproteobacteria bacterium]